MKQELRKYFLKQASLDKVNAKDVCEKVYSLVKDFNHVAVYLPIKKEIDLSDLINKLLPHTQVFVPYVSKGTKLLSFRRLDSLASLAYDDANIPTSPLLETIPVSKLDAIIMACIAVNRDGYRLGYDGGYYDQSLADYHGLKIGVVHDNCITNEKFQNDYDIRLDYLVSEKQVIKITKE